jgi:glycosyltransferase involved in cell wall biosynthesis
MDYFANVEGARWFVEEVFPLIRDAEPRAEFVIVGSRPTEEVLQLGRRDGIKVTGFVKDVEPYLLGATVCVVPLRIARGVQNKVLEAMAAGCAIVATHEAAAGLRVASGDQLLLASAPRRFADAVVELIRDWRLREALGDRARYYVETEHDWAPLLQKFATLVETAGARGRGSEGTGFRAIAGN